MTFTELPLRGAFITEPKVFQDERGHFFRFFCKDEFASIGHQKEWVQMNHSYTAKKAAIRGMHYQLHPFSEIKYLRCIRGKIWDVVVDIREGSPTFLHWYGVELSAENRKGLYIPEGFAHGFETLTEDCELIYHHSAYYTAGMEGGLRYNDPRVNITWPLEPVILSERDQNHPFITTTFQGIKL